MAKADTTATPSGSSEEPSPASAVAAPMWPMSLHFQNLSAGMPHTVNLSGGGAVWHIGQRSQQIQGLIISAPAGALVGLQQIIMTQTSTKITPAQSMRFLDISLFVQSAQSLLLGSLTLPPGVILTLRSNYDRTNVVGNGSWALSLGAA